MLLLHLLLEELHRCGPRLLGYLNTLLHKASKKTKSNIASNMGSDCPSVSCRKCGVLFPCLLHGAKLLFFNLSTCIEIREYYNFSPSKIFTSAPKIQLLRQHLRLTCEEGLEEID